MGYAAAVARGAVARGNKRESTGLRVAYKMLGCPCKYTQQFKRCGSSMLKFTAALLIKIGLEHLFHRRIHLSHVPNAEAAFIGFCKNKKLAEGGSLCGFSIGSLAQDRLLT